MSIGQASDEQTQDEVLGARVLWGHQAAGSDLDDAPGPLATLEVLMRLLAHLPERVLLAGPRSARLVASMNSSLPSAGQSVWFVGADGFERRHLFARERAALMAEHGLVPVVTYAALPRLVTHRVLVCEAALVSETCARRWSARAVARSTTFSTKAPWCRWVGG